MTRCPGCDIKIRPIDRSAGHVVTKDGRQWHKDCARAAEERQR